jgi:hypothetical protein
MTPMEKTPNSFHNQKLKIIHFLGFKVGLVVQNLLLISMDFNLIFKILLKCFQIFSKRIHEWTRKKKMKKKK